MEDSTQIEQLFSHSVPQIYASGLTVFIMGVMMFFYNWKLSIAVFWVIPVAILVFYLSKKFQNKLFTILKYIAKDKIGASEKFQIDLDEQIDKIPHFPFQYKPSIYFDDKNVRDMTFKKYTINYEINLDKNSIEVMDIFNKNKPSS